ncbi:M57 family metalloprotease [Planctomycetes bacterium K23_9]|uniref:GEVED domain-containing protein n=1 Tax=Stieleria marina TaxID=1930275 RepID=A0A517P1Y6_9BACT|nr:hypothetical protein K239x_53930 [Planctomycetes bacterium K23_9]
MIKRTESNTPSKQRRDKKRGISKRRRMMMESLEQRQLLAAEIVDLPAVTLPTYEQSRDIGTVQAFSYIESETGTSFGENDSLQTADFVPLGTGSGQQDTIDITGALPFTTVRPPISLPDGTVIPQSFSADIDYFNFDLRAGDILDIATLSAAGSFTLFNPDGSVWYAITDNQAAGGGVFYPVNSPLQTLGNAAYAQVIPEDGRYTVAIAPNNTQSSYTVGLRVYRPAVESLPIGAQQYVFLELDGGIYSQTILNDGTGIPQVEVFRVPSLLETLPVLGLPANDTVAYNRLVDLTLEELERQFDYLGVSGNAGDFDQTGVPGDYGVTILNSRDHVDPGNHPLVTRVAVGGVSGDINGPAGLFGISQTIDVGNFGMSDTVFTVFDALAVSATLGVPISPSASVLEAAADLTALTISHELGHSFGLRHTLRANNIVSIIDGQVNDAQDLGVGVDGIYGTPDDVNVDFIDDVFDPAEGILGTQYVTNGLANTLVTGTVGGSVNGRVFNDLGRDGNGTNDAGIPGVTVFVDSNGDGVLNPGESSTLSAFDGTFTLSAANGSANVVAIRPDAFVETTSTSVSVAFGGGASSVQFGFAQVNPDVTGFKFSDLNENAIPDANENAIGGVYIYLDLDGDDRPDLGEPAAITGADGTYSINFPGPGTFAIREVAEPGFTQTLPVSGEFTVIYDGTTFTAIDGPTRIVPSQTFPVAPGEAVVSNGTNWFAYATADVVSQGTSLVGVNFGNSPSRDYGDAPVTGTSSSGATFGYRTLDTSHGIVDGLSLGIEVDRDVAGQPSIDALGDDTNGSIQTDGSVLDDEDGVGTLTTPFAVGDTNVIQVVANNTTGTSAYLQAWMDFNADGVFDDSEQIAKNVQLGSGTFDLSVDVPTDAVIGTTYARFRYSYDSNLDWFGGADSGEVEDYAFTILGDSKIANNDIVPVERNAVAFDVTDQILANDFADNGLTIIGIQTVVDPNAGLDDVKLTVDTKGQVRLNNGRIFYTPVTGEFGEDKFIYTVQDGFDRVASAIVTLSIEFLSDNPIAVDDFFTVPRGSSDRALNVLDNDLPSRAGGLSIISALPGDRGGNITIIGGGQSLRYTPQVGFIGTEQFVYNVQDNDGKVTSATVSVDVGREQRVVLGDYDVEFSIELLDRNYQPLPSAVPVGTEFYVRVFVEDLDDGIPDGVASAFLDLLYSDQQVNVLPKPEGSTSAFDFDIDFGELFQGVVVNDFDTTDPSDTNPFRQGNSQVPGILNEIGALQTTIPNATHDVRTELLTIGMVAAQPGIAVFQGDPANNIISETVVVGSDEIVPVNRLLFGAAELEILPGGTETSSAIDDSFPDNLDSLERSFGDSSVTSYRLNVLANDNLGPTDRIISRQILTEGGLGQATFNDNGTVVDPDDPSTFKNLNDDYIDYVPNNGAVGFESFTYFILTADGIRSTAEVTLAINKDQIINDADRDLVDINFVLVDEAGAPLDLNNGVSVGDTFGVQVNLKDIRPSAIVNTSVFAGYLDVLYDNGLIATTDTTTASRNQVSQDFFDFDVTFQVDPQQGFRVDAAVGNAQRPGIIDEFGSFLIQDVAENLTAPNGNLMATIYFEAIASGTARVVGSPADSFPFQDTLLSRENDPVPVSQIRYDVLEFNITGPQGEFIQNPTLAADVNNDGDISPLDALLVLNRLSSEAQNVQGESASNNGHYLDVSGNGDLSPLDALMVLNALADARANAQSGQGELVSDILDSSTTQLGTDSSSVASDSVFAELKEGPVVDASVGDTAVGSLASISIADGETDADEDNELLNLLADDLLDLNG